ncbi:MAG: amidohydrolase [Rhodanobacteraceae bacterium]|nr:amidohydrolase [Rhodanobacteraceae bacterium]MBP7622762.1 amidohydrolase [Xanthomonadales bacterium]
MRATTLFLGLIASCVVAAAPPAADLIVHDARIYTVDATHPVVQALVVRDGRVVFVGSTREAMTFRAAKTQVLDLDGAAVIPGMIDAHAHLLGLGQSLQTIDLRGTASFDAVIARVVERRAATVPGRWIVGRGWDQNDWADTRFPEHAALSANTADHPVLLERVDGHAVLVNAAALKAAGITRDTPDPAGGRIEHDAEGEPSGVLVDNAIDLVTKVMPAATPDELRDAVTRAIAELQRWGLTGIHDAGVTRDVIGVYEALAREGRHGLRNYVMVAGNDADIDWALQRGAQNGLYDGRLWIRSIKLSADGALGSRGAWLLEPYADAPGHSGLATLPAGRVRAVATRALKAGFQVNTHAIGDRANRVVLDELSEALDAVPVADHRFRIEHAQILHPDDLARFAELGVIPSMQSSHQTSDMYWAGVRIGPTRELGAYAWRSLLDTGVIVPNGSDLPVELTNPLISFHAAVSRQDAKDWPAGGWHPEQRMTRDEALKSMTLWPAQAAFMEAEVGSLGVGKRADFVVLDQDLMRVPAELILRTRVRQTWLGGERVYAAD